AFDGGATGASRAVNADLDTLPLYLEAGAIVPMLRDTIDTLSPVVAASPIDSFATDPGVLFVRIAPGPASTFAVYDGTKLAQAPNGLQYAPGTVFGKGAMFEVIATAMPASVRNGSTTLAQQASFAALKAATSGWFWEPATG